MRGMKRVCKGIAIVALAGLLVINILVLVLQRSDGGESLGQLPFALLRVSGGSMEGMLHDGDAILATAEEFSALKTGDVIVFSRGGELIIHEIVEIRDEAVITKGRANAVPDEPVTQEEYRAKMLLRLPALGKIAALYTHSTRYAVFAVLVTVLIFGGDLFSALYDRLFRRERRAG